MNPETNPETREMDADDANETDRTEMRVILEDATSGPAGSSFWKEFAIEALTDIENHPRAGVYYTRIYG